MFGYATELRSMTQGRASYSMEFGEYAKTPNSVAEKIIKDYDLIVDCTDNHLSRLIINDMCFEKKKIIIFYK